jgi:hypothetical protein
MEICNTACPPGGPLGLTVRLIPLSQTLWHEELTLPMKLTKEFNSRLMALKTSGKKLEHTQACTVLHELFSVSANVSHVGNELVHLWMERIAYSTHDLRDQIGPHNHSGNDNREPSLEH